MTVTFSTAPDDAPALDDTLRPLLARARNSGSSPEAIVLSLLARGLQLSYKPAQVGASLRRVDRQASSVVGTPAWHRLVTRSRRFAAASSSNGGAALRLQISRRVIGHLLTPAPDTANNPRREASARIQFGVLGSLFMTAAEERGFDTILGGGGFLALQSGLSERQVTRQLKILRELAWLSPTTRGRAGVARYRLSRLSHTEDRIAYEFGEVVDSMASSEPSTLGDVIRSALHPSWTYPPGPDELNPRAWLALVCHRAGTVGTLGLSSVAVRKAKQIVERHLPGIWNGGGDTTLEASLNSYAERSGAFSRQDVAAARLARNAATRRSELADLAERRATENETRRQSRSILKRVWVASGGTPPRPDASQETIGNWASSAQQVFILHPVPADQINALRETLTSQLLWRQYIPEVAARIVDYVIPEVVAAGYSMVSPSHLPSPIKGQQ